MTRLLGVFILFLTFTSGSAQILSPDSLLKSNFETYQYQKVKPRAFMSFKDKSIWYKINPLSYTGAGLMFGYQRLISQQLGSECAYETSCSQHAKKAIEEYGLLKGSMLGFYQLQSCTPKTGYDFPPHAINKDGEIINPVVLNED